MVPRGADRNRTHARSDEIPFRRWRTERELHQRLRRPPGREELATALGSAWRLVDLIEASPYPFAPMRTPVSERKSAPSGSSLAEADVVAPVAPIDRAGLQRLLGGEVGAPGGSEGDAVERRSRLGAPAPEDRPHPQAIQCPERRARVARSR